MSLQLPTCRPQRLSQPCSPHCCRRGHCTKCLQLSPSPLRGTQLQQEPALTHLPCPLWFLCSTYKRLQPTGTAPARRDTGAGSRGDVCHTGKDLHGQPTELSKCHLSGGSPSSDALTPPVSSHLMASVGIFYVPKH